MRLFAVCVRDSAADAFHAPLFFPAVGMAERWFKDECRSPQSDLAKHPSDYELYLVGFFLTEDGSLSVDDGRRLLLRGADCVPTVQ